MSDLLLEVLQDDSLSLGAKGLFSYLYTVNKDCEKDLIDILEDINIHQNTFATHVHDLVCCGYLKARYIYTLNRKPMFAFRDTGFEFKVTSEGIYYRSNRKMYEVYIKTKDNPRKYLGSASSFKKAQHLKRIYRLEHKEEFI